LDDRADLFAALRRRVLGVGRERVEDRVEVVVPEAVPVAVEHLADRQLVQQELLLDRAEGVRHGRDGTPSGRSAPGRSPASGGGTQYREETTAPGRGRTKGGERGPSARGVVGRACRHRE